MGGMIYQQIDGSLSSVNFHTADGWRWMRGAKSFASSHLRPLVGETELPERG